VQDLDTALDIVRTLLLDRDHLVRAVAAGHRRGATPSVTRAELRPVVLKAGPRMQIVTSDGSRPQTRQVSWDEARGTVEDLLAEPFGNWHVETVTETVQVRVTKKGAAQVHRAAGSEQEATAQPHDRRSDHLIDPGDPLFEVIGGNAAKRRQVDAFLRALAATLPADVSSAARPLRVVDLGCGNAYLTFAAYRYLSERGLDIDLVGVDVREDQRARNTAIAHQLGWSEHVRFVSSTIADAEVGFGNDPAGTAADGENSAGGTGAVDIVLALHACDTATDEALARAITWKAPTILAAPCCHHDIAAQLRTGPAARPEGLIVGYPILRERFADVLTDSLRAALLRLHGYRVEVVEFVGSAHTPRNVLLRARRTGNPPTEDRRRDYADLVGSWGLTPHLATLLDTGHEPADRKPADRQTAQWEPAE